LTRAAEGPRYGPLLDTVLVLYRAGFWVIPLHPRVDFGKGRSYNGKRPIGKAWGAERNTPDTFLNTCADYLGPWSEPAGRTGTWVGELRPGIGIALGPGRAPGGGWLIDMEGDGPEAEESRVRLLGGAGFDTLAWQSARGTHRLLTVEEGRMLKLLKPIRHLDRGGFQSGVYKLPAFPGLELRVGGPNENGSVKQLHSACPPTPGDDGRPRRWTGGEP
jgi:hypothetical protein